MTSVSKPERMAHLRDAIAGIEVQTRARSQAIPARLPLARTIDPMLGGGLAQDGLHEIAPAAPGDAAALGFALALAARFSSRASSASAIVLISEDFCSIECGALYGPGLAAHGLSLKRLTLVHAPDGQALLWAMEEALKSGAIAAVIGEMWSVARHYGLAASRRLLLAARAGGAPGLLVLEGAAGKASAVSSAADTRFEIAASPSRPPEHAHSTFALPGASVFATRLLKARLRPSAQGPPSRALDDKPFLRLEWQAGERTLRDPTVPLPMVLASGDRSRPQAAQG